MRIFLSPQFSDETQPSFSISGELLTINGDTLDLSVVAEGADIPSDGDDQSVTTSALHPMLDGPIYREGGELHLWLRLWVPLSPVCTDPWMCFPEPVVVTEDGPVDLPFATYSEVVEQKVEGGTNIVTTTYRWHQPDEVETVFVPDAPEPEEPAAEAPEEDA